ncbi:O-antigen ligase family protein [Mangrovibrevibacter kandeliae]|uniref:O-antigen ligase family protein n=1 Tax=Mangrovibrevibacter kandeliae TaxID=2968473 RepID=UPI0021179ABC|nr:O-antigen ligase family protein [Aurantimonas sp. CSK15Z-1]MCQ8780747.1 O-antigen ligase family protein [Aurantimonas sp. CSK15Z-1]
MQRSVNRYIAKQLPHPLATLLTAPPEALGRRNRLSNGFFYVAAACLGSGASIVCALLACWAVISAVLGRFPLALRREELPIVVTTTAFALVTIGAVLAQPGGADASRLILPMVIYFAPIFLVPRMRLSRLRHTLRPALFGAAIGGTLLLPIIGIEYALWTDRVQGFSGNPGPLSITALLTCGLSLLGLSRSRSRAYNVLAILGAAGASTAVLLSGMRGAWPALPLVLLAGLAIRKSDIAALWRRASRRRRIAAASLCILLACGIVAVVAPAMDARVDAFWSDLARMTTLPEDATSLNQRKAIYVASVEAFLERPLFGYGPQNIWQAITPYLDEQTFPGYRYSHLHDIGLTVGVGSGLLGLLSLLAMIVAPLWTAWRARHGVEGRLRLGFAVILVTSFLLPGLTNIMLYHDILDAVWIYSLSLIAASVTAPVHAEESEAEQR